MGTFDANVVLTEMNNGKLRFLWGLRLEDGFVGGDIFFLLHPITERKSV